MNATTQQLLFIGEIALLTIIIISLLQRGFFWTWLRARIQPNKIIMIKCWGGKKPYYRTGRLENNPQRIIFKDLHSKQEKSIMIDNPKEEIHIDMGVQWIEVNTQKDGIFQYKAKDKDGKPITVEFTGFKAINYTELVKAINGHDGEKYEGLCLRHLYRPSLMDDQLKKVFWITIVLLVLVAGNAYFTYKNMKGLEFISQQIADTCGASKIMLANITHTII